MHPTPLPSGPPAAAFPASIQSGVHRQAVIVCNVPDDGSEIVACLCQSVVAAPEDNDSYRNVETMDHSGTPNVRSPRSIFSATPGPSPTDRLVLMLDDGSIFSARALNRRASSIRPASASATA